MREVCHTGIVYSSSQISDIPKNNRLPELKARIAEITLPEIFQSQTWRIGDRKIHQDRSTVVVALAHKQIHWQSELNNEAGSGLLM